jgi:F0F1-type ATP synthase membrane subunit b/b'
MSIQEVIGTRRDTEILTQKVELYEKEGQVVKKEAELIIKEARLNAEKIVNDAEADAKNILLQKERIEKELKEFIQTEKELIKRYEKK